MPLTKSELRSQLKHARLEILPSEHRMASQSIVDGLQSVLDWSKIKNLHVFEPILILAEPDINTFITDLEDKNVNIKIFSPRLIENDWEIIGINGSQPPDNFDLVVVPMLGFDPKTLHRIGYGGGYYDKFLATQPEAQKVGVCFEIGNTSDLPTEKHDIALDLIITEKQVYRSK
ncbi:MAG TPA: 5-formyltetrahydrofolate cyclo-ligase [Candidatus Saccharimonadales bacterium]|nr:5-formyltetrahydrofolate cyclo-ligase [Candidatus Saccharimonadales bacterium]